MVNTHAQTMRPAMPQLTARVPRVMPTPTMAPVMVCVVETGIPRLREREDGHAAAGLGAEAADGLQLGQAVPHGPHDAPAAEERAEARWPPGRAATTQKGTAKGRPDQTVP